MSRAQCVVTSVVRQARIPGITVTDTRCVFVALCAVFLSIERVAAQATIFVVRHAEKAQSGDQKDPDLSDAGRARAASLAAMLKDVGITAIYVSEYKRTQQTAEPLARAARIAVTIVPGKETDLLVSKLKKTEGAALVVGHSNTVPEILKAFDASAAVTINEGDYDNLFILPASSPSKVVRLHFPAGEANAVSPKADQAVRDD